MLNPLSNEAREIIWGSLIGDGGIFLGNGNRHYCYKESHSLQQVEYINWKYDFLKPVAGSRIYSTKSFHKRNQKYYTTLQFTTKAMSYFTRLRKIFYPKGKKFIRRKILNKLTPLGLAVWFMDDGGCSKNNRNYPQLNIYSCGYSIEENLEMQKYFQEKWDIEVRIHCRKNRPQVYFNKPNSLKFIEIIKPHIISSMLYKIRYFLQTSSTVDNTAEDIV